MSNRGHANQALFEARILLDAWELAAQRGLYAADVLARAFCPAMLLHLRRSYGWYLLAVTNADAQSDPTALPNCVEQLTPPPEGRSLAPELREFTLLERDGWLGDMLRAQDRGAASASPNANLLGSDRREPGLGEFAGWISSLASIMTRMDDSLDEC